ncbi:hypothetical protein ACN47E_002093 [Coniothyrium glycines]
MILSSILVVSLLLSPHCALAQASSSLSTRFLPRNSTLVEAGTSYILDSNDLSAGIPFTTNTPERHNATTRFITTTKYRMTVAESSSVTASRDDAVPIATSATLRASKTRPCNGYPEFCDRRFSNISMVVAHNSPFVRQHSAASNQLHPVLDQLNDGIRGLQFETQQPSSTSGIRLCHTSCNILDVGPLESYLATVKGWLDDNPYEVLGIIMGNNNGQSTRIPAAAYVAPFQDSGLLDYVWTPSSKSLNLTHWPTLAELIIENKRVVVMIDYGADRESVPWLLSEFDYMWETPFSPTDPAFPCTQQRPPNQAENVSRERMYMMNHNLNIEMSISNERILIPAYPLLEQVNAVSGDGSVGMNVQNCTATWGHPPNWILVDYYNVGNFNGSVFQVAATANNVTYNADRCCGSVRTSAAVIHRVTNLLAIALALITCFFV